MTAVFEKILEMSGTAAVVIVVVLAIRLLLRKAPRKYSYALWAVAAFRLVCPVSFRSVFSIFRFANVVERVEITQTVDPIPSAVIGSSPVVTPPVTVTAPPAVISVPPTANVEVPPVVTEPAADLAARAMDVAAIIWLAVLVCFLIYGVVSYVRLRRRMANAVLLEGRVYQSDRVRSPFILGFVCPKIYLPFGLTEEQQRYVLAHERYHIRRLDHIIRPVAFLILAVHWFNPLVWAAYYLVGRDMEMSCDEKVLGGAENIRKAYSTTLLSFAANRRFPSPSPLAFGETGVKGRIKNILNWKKPRLWVTIIALVVVVVVVLTCAANPTSTPYQWAKALSAEDVDRAEVYTTEGGPRTAELSRQEIEELVAQLNLVPRADYKKTPKRSAWAFGTKCMVTLVCDGVEYVLNYGEGLMTVSCRDESVDWQGETHWFVENEGLKGFLERLTVNEEPPSDEYTTYVSVKCVYQYPAISAIMPDDSGKLYLIGENKAAILDKEGKDEGSYFSDLPPWQELTVEEWKELFWAGFEPDISGYKEPRIRWLSENFALADLDGTLWILLLPELESGVGDTVFFAFELAPVNEGEPSPIGWYQSVECVYMSPFSSWMSINGDSGYYYRVEGDTLTRVHNGSLPTLGDATGFAYLHDAESGWEELTEERWRKLVDDSLMFTDLWDTIKEYESRKIRFYEGSYFLLNLDGELWVGTGSSHPDGTGYIWDLYRLEPMTKEPKILKEWKEIFRADLNHDGNDESIEVVHDTQTMSYSLTATETMGGNELWKAEVYAGADGNDCYYLYEKDGKTYLMRWSPNEVQSMCHYSYEVFWFDENGDKQVLAENALQYDIFSSADILKVDLDELRAFEAEVNGLLADATMIFADRGEQIGDPDEPVTSVWLSPAEEWERVQSEQAGSRVLAEWKADLTHDGNPEWIRVVTTDWDSYEVRVETEDGSYVYWTGQAGRMHVDGNGIYLYQRDGKDYLMTWLPYSSTGIFSLDYCVFSLDNDGGQHVLVENGLMYDVMDSNMMRLDVADIRAFEDEVNALLSDAFVLVDTAGGDVLYSTQDNLISNPFSGYAADAEFWQAEFFGNTPAVHWFVDYEAENGLIGAVTDFIMNQLKEAGITSGGAAVYLLEDIPTGTADNTKSLNIYRVEYMLSEYDRQAGMAREQEVRQVYFMTCSGVNSTGSFWELMDVLTEEELQQYDTAAFEAEYGGDDLWLYRAAVMETYNNGKNS